MRLLIAGGGTGGHLFPGIAIAQELRARDPHSAILFVGTERGIEVRAVPKAGFDLALLPIRGVRRKGVLALITGVLRIPIAVLQAIQLVRRFKPDVAVSVGGYAAGPAVLAAWLLRVPCVVMEQNAVPGVTNRVLSTLARAIIAGLPTDVLPAHKTRVLGNPVRAALLGVHDKPYAPAARKRLLVFGGSQGAKALNDVMIAVMQQYAGRDLGWSVVHQTGPNDLERVQQAYAALGNPAHVTVMPFIDDMAKAYADADLVLCRSGAMTIAELTACGRPAILVPYPHAVDDHQTANARTMVRGGGAILVPQHELTPARVFELLDAYRNDDARLIAMARASLALGKPTSASDSVDMLQSMRASRA